MKEKIKKYWKDGIIVFLCFMVAFLFWRGVGFARQVIKNEKEIKFLYTELIKEKIILPTIDDCLSLYTKEELCATSGTKIINIK